MAMTWRSAAMPGGGRRRMRRGEMPPKWSSRSARVQVDGKSCRIRTIPDSLQWGYRLLLRRLGGVGGQRHGRWRTFAAVDQGVQITGADWMRQGEQFAVGEAATAADGDAVAGDEVAHLGEARLVE